MFDKLNHYQALGLTQAATEAEVRNAYKALVLRFHPVISLFKIHII